MLRNFHFWQWELRLIDFLAYTRHDPSVVVDSDILRHYRDGEYFSLEHSRTIGSFTLGHIRDGEHFSLEHSHLIGSFILGRIHLVEGDQIDS